MALTFKYLLSNEALLLLVPLAFAMQTSLANIISGFQIQAGGASSLHDALLPRSRRFFGISWPVGSRCNA